MDRKVLKILEGIPNDKQTKHKFDLENAVARIYGQKISIYLQNVVSYLKFLMGQPGFQHNQIYKSYYIFNQSENRVYNEMYTNK